MIPTGLWDDPFEQLVVFHRSVLGPPLVPGPFIDQALWNAVVLGTHLDAAGAVTNAVADPLAVYRPSWHTPTSLNAVATEVDLLESVQPVGTTNEVWSVYRELSTVDVLLHHRDTRPLLPNAAFAMLLWQSNASALTLRNTNLSALPAFAQGLAAGGPLGAVPGNWHIETSGGSALFRLPVGLDARSPRAVSIDVDLSAVPGGHFVMFVAVGGSTTDPCTAPAVAPITTIGNLVRGWPHAAARLVQVFPR